MTEYDLGKVVGDDGEAGNGIASITKTGTSGLVDTYTITFDDGSTTTFTVTNGSNASVDIVTSWNSTTSDSKVPSEKLSKDSLDGKLDNAISSTAVSVASNDNILITDYSDSNKVKRVANVLASHVKDSSAHSNIGSSASATQATINSSIDTALSNKVSKSQTSGLLKNDGSVDTTSYLSSLPSHNHDDRYYTESEVDTALSGKQATLVSGTSIKTINNESLLGSGNITIQGGSSVDIVTAWESTPSDSKVASEKLVKNTIDGLSIPTKTSDLTNDGDGTNAFLTQHQSLSNYVQKSSTTGLLKNDGTVMTSGTGSSNWAVGNHTHSGYISTSSTTGLVKNDGSIDTNAYLTSSAIANMLTTSDVVDNLTSTSATAPLSAKQGKVLNDLIGSAIAYINQ